MGEHKKRDQFERRTRSGSTPARVRLKSQLVSCEAGKLFRLRNTEQSGVSTPYSLSHNGILLECCSKLMDLWTARQIVNLLGKPQNMGKMTWNIINDGLCKYSRISPQQLPQKAAVVGRWPLVEDRLYKKRKISNRSLTLTPDVHFPMISLVHNDTHFCITALSVLEDATFSFSSFNFCRIGQKRVKLQIQIQEPVTHQQCKTSRSVSCVVTVRQQCLRRTTTFYRPYN